ncbi:ABC transporter permease subunit [Rhodococcus sp. Q]|uniref:ABC transporter permease subunit n=1 Tax=Rhodococcus sp. Q TaxID=2502252 RepID=UPI00201621DB|nr:ABC transporter permease subunit [Rhodococcus sp. Q]
MLAAELVKLISMRTTRWCGGLTVVVAVGHALLWADINRLATDPDTPTQAARNLPPSVMATQLGCVPGLVLVMIMAALAATTEYRTGTIQLTFQTEPNRGKVLLAKTVAASLLAWVIGEVAAWLAYGTAKLVNHAGVGSITSGAEVRTIAGTGLIYAVGAAIAVAVGMVVRSTVAAVALILIYTVIVENFIAAVPSIGSKIEPWMPFTMATQFVLDGRTETLDGLPWLETSAALPSWWALAYIIILAATLTTTTAIVVTKRDA